MRSEALEKTEKQVGNGAVDCTGKNCVWKSTGSAPGTESSAASTWNVKTGLITGMFGLCGSGRTEFLECIYGTRKLAGGEVTIDGKTTTVRLRRNPSDREWRLSVRTGEEKP